MNFVKKHPFWSSILIALILGEVFAIFSTRPNPTDLLNFNDLFLILLIGIISGTFIIYPFILTLLNIVFLFIPNKYTKIFEYITLVLGALYSSLYMSFTNISFNADWTKTLYNNDLHTPIFTPSYPTIIAIACIAFLGYCLLSWIPLKNMAPLVIVCSISMLYLGIIECTLWMIQIFPDMLFILFPANCILFAIKLIIYKIHEWNTLKQDAQPYDNMFLAKCHQCLIHSSNWPLLAFIFMWPLLGILLCILTLFGQQPDAFIKAWTETSDWNLSKRIAPQNIYQDEHYLCTVAAGGHPKVVKPLRLGRRHNHEVIVNRQLCIANAFEQVLEEKTPKFHYHIRSFYDTYGFPIAKLIHSPYIADAIYFLMKPLEWFFLIVLYLCDIHPENRIALQYIPKPPKQQ